MRSAFLGQAEPALGVVLPGQLQPQGGEQPGPEPEVAVPDGHPSSCWMSARARHTGRSRADAHLGERARSGAGPVPLRLLSLVGERFTPSRTHLSARRRRFCDVPFSVRLSTARGRTRRRGQPQPRSVRTTSRRTPPCASTTQGPQGDRRPGTGGRTPRRVRRLDIQRVAAAEEKVKSDCWSSRGLSPHRVPPSSRWEPGRGLTGGPTQRRPHHTVHRCFPDDLLTVRADGHHARLRARGFQWSRPKWAMP